MRVPPRDRLSNLGSVALLRGRAGFPPRVLESKWRGCKSRGSVTDFHWVWSDPGGMLEADDDLWKRFELEINSSSPGGVLAFPPVFELVPFLRGFGGKS